MTDIQFPNRRHFLRLLGAGSLAVLGLPPLWAAPGRHRFPDKHPDPRHDYTAAKILTAAQLNGDQELIALFDGVRAIPQIVDGIRCSCGCAGLPGFYSLISCYEGVGAMSTWCPICQGTGALAVRLHGRGRTLDQIREAVDARY